MKLVQEADELSYRCAFACQKQAYIVTTKKGSHDFKDKYTKTSIIQHFKSKGKVLDVDYTVQGYNLIEPEHIVKYTLNRMVKKLWEIRHPEISAITDVELWISPSDKSNFRYGVVNMMGPNGLGYKAGRGAKPHYLGFIKELLIEKYGARESFGYEADDMLGMGAGEGVILSHIDKDINMIEGMHYNHVTGEVYTVPSGLGTISAENNKIVGRGLLFFYLQLLTGDSIDNIPGCLNPAKESHKKQPIISGKEGIKLLEHCTTEDDAWNAVAQMYQYTYKNNWVDAIMECADLLWIVRQEGITGRSYLKSRGYL